MTLNDWVKPDGSTIKLNDFVKTEAQAERLGWKKKQVRKSKAKDVDSPKNSKRVTEDTKPK